jgi:O-antigen biosynthesis protein
LLNSYGGEEVYKQWREYFQIKRSGLFDPVYYLLNYPDVRQADVDPLMHFIKFGWKEGKNPSAYFDITFYLHKYPDVEENNVNPLYHYINYGKKEGRLIILENHEQDILPFFINRNKNRKIKLSKLIGKINMKNLIKVIKYWRLHGFKSLINRIKSELTDEKIQKQIGKIITDENTQKKLVNIITFPNNTTYEKIIQNRFPTLQPINCYYSPHTGRRLNLVTDSINSGSLFGGVATGMILSTLIAEKWGCELRIITRSEPPDKHNYLSIIKNNNLNDPQNVDFLFVDCINSKSELPVGDDEYFLTTSWWTTHSVLKSVNEKRIYYLIQEDERSFYPFGDDHFLCSQIMHNSEIKFIINSQLLYDYFLSEGFSNFKIRGDWFEPSFPQNIFYYDQHDPLEKKNFFFYARPNNIRNLYYLGIRVINQALEIGLIDLARWNINFIGKDLEKIKFVDSFAPNIYQNLSWDEYAKMIRKMDLGLCLMYSPHTSYPPLDLAASGSVAITNKYANKQSLDNYSKNIICCDLDEKSLLDGIKNGMILSSDANERVSNYNNNGMMRDWNLSFNKILSTMNIK